MLKTLKLETVKVEITVHRSGVSIFQYETVFLEDFSSRSFVRSSFPTDTVSTNHIPPMSDEGMTVFT